MAIVPDDKDWTWVLERACDECGFDVAHVTRDTLGEKARANAHQWVLVLSRDGARRRTREDKWSDLEYACHVRDVYRLFDQRLDAMLREHDPLFENWDQDATAVADRYDLQEPGDVARELLVAAQLYADRCDALEGAQWVRPGRRSNGSVFSVESLVLYGFHDVHHHLWDVGVTDAPTSTP
jgi:hypothetical protein